MKPNNVLEVQYFCFRQADRIKVGPFACVEEARKSLQQLSENLRGYWKLLKVTTTEEEE